ncbi:MAG: hypothetical protein IJG68_03185 [Bacilli bacterium]|nr:hypothetical protein [Bacilli bacterium]
MEEVLYHYHCNICNTEFSVPSNMNFVSCVFCQSKNVQKLDHIDYDDYYCLPYIDTLNDAKKDYRSKIRFNPFLPLIFRKKKTINGIKKLYLPCMLYSVEVNGTVSFFGLDEIRNVKMIPKQTFESEFSVNILYDNVLVCGFKEVNEAMLSTVNKFNYSVLEHFDSKKNKDIYLIPMNEDAEKEKEELLEQIMKNTISIVRENVPHQKKKIKDNQLKIEIKEQKKVMVPVYFLRIKYREKDYYYLMNGHTGNSIIDLVSSKISTIVFSAIVFFIILGLLIVFSIFF